jgi:hypothetical protein
MDFFTKSALYFLFLQMQNSQLTVFSTAFFPPVSYLSQCIKKGQFLIETQETYPKQTYRNRCVIATANGTQSLTVPVRKPFGNQTRTAEIKISEAEPWQRLHKRALETAYKASPFYDFYIDDLLPVFDQQYKTLIALNDRAFKLILKLLKIDLSYTFTTQYAQSSALAADYRNTFSPKIPFQKNVFPQYYQVYAHKYPFQADLSILDLLFNEGPQSIIYLKNLANFNPDKQS